MNLIVGPPGSGKTTRLLRRALEATAAQQRVWWVGLPSQRSAIYRLATRHGALLGLEFLSLQQVYYRLVARSLNPRRLLIGTGRIAYVGEALLQLRGELPSPGEARLFTRAVAEAKRFLVNPEKIPGKDAETRRFRAVYQRYEQLKETHAVWDYDDFRAEALRLAEAGEASPEADLIVVDGFRELGPLDVRLFTALARQGFEMWLALLEAPPEVTPRASLPARQSTSLSVYRAANPVSESRWVLSSLKRDLATGKDPLELAVILPPSRLKAFVSLADEYGVPLADETPEALADTPGGRLLLNLLELPDYPTASRLLAIPELLPLANAALNHGVAGREALTALAEEVGLGEVWRKWLALLETPDAALSWAEQLVDTTLYELRRGRIKEGLDWEQFRGQLMERAKEAASLARGASFRAWWVALLQEASIFERPQGGVALLTATLASGRRFGRVYLLQAVERAYGVGEAEDYFVPEELREPLARAGLPRRFLGRDEALFAELLSRGDEVIVTYPEADREGPLIAEPSLVGEGALPLPEVPAGSRLELGARSSYAAQTEPLELGDIGLQQLKYYDDCAFRYWAERLLPTSRDLPWWLTLRHELCARPKLNAARLEVLKGGYPEAAGWLEEYAEPLTRLTYGVTLPESGEEPKAYLDAAQRSAGEATLYRFVAPGQVDGATAAESYLDNRWNELCAAGYLLERYPEQVKGVHIVVWPILGEPVDAFEGGIRYHWRRIASREDKARAAYARFQQGEVAPAPGFHCRECSVFDFCREGKR